MELPPPVCSTVHQDGSGLDPSPLPAAAATEQVQTPEPPRPYTCPACMPLWHHQNPPVHVEGLCASMLPVSLSHAWSCVQTSRAHLRRTKKPKLGRAADGNADEWLPSGSAVPKVDSMLMALVGRATAMGSHRLNSMCSLCRLPSLAHPFD